MAFLLKAARKLKRHFSSMATFGSLFPTAAGHEDSRIDASIGRIQAKNLEIHAILSQRFNLPPEITEQILDHMESWLRAGPFVFGPVASHLCVQDGDKLIVETPRLSLKEVKNLRKVVISLTSKDQGWSSYPKFHGTFEHCHSWWDFGIERPSPEVFPTARDATQTLSKPLGETDSEATDESSMLNWVEVQKIKIQCNRHAHNEMESYLIELDINNEIFESLQPGDRMILSAGARYPGWANYVQQAELGIWFRGSLV